MRCRIFKVQINNCSQDVELDMRNVVRGVYQAGFDFLKTRFIDPWVENVTSPLKIAAQEAPQRDAMSHFQRLDQ